jgi:acylphosphatase
MTDQQQRFHAIVHGRVQGVSFRYYTEITANSLGVRGWVRNLSNGTVEVTAEATRPLLDELLRFLHEGPPGARVTSVDLEWTEASNQFKDFRVIG